MSENIGQLLTKRARRSPDLEGVVEPASGRRLTYRELNERSNRVANALEAGSVWINDYGTLPASVPFGGYKMSGIGRENGANAIEHYTQVKMIYSSLVPHERYM